METRGDRFLSSLRDGRTVWLHGQRVDVATHPAFRGTLASIRKLFDMLDHPETQRTVGFQPPGSERFVHSSFLVPTTTEELEQRRVSFACWAKETRGVMSRLSDYARSLVTGWYAARETLGRDELHFQEKITRYYECARDQDLIMTTALLDPQIDRSKGLDDSDIADKVLHVVRETKEGIVVRGAKMIATSAPYAHDFLIFPFHRLREEERKHANALIVPANLPGLHIVCRDSFAKEKEDDYPLSARYDEMDAVLFFDDVLIPWERVLFHNNPEGVWRLRTNKTANALAFHQTVVRLLAKLEFVTGVAFAITESIGVNKFLHIQEKLGELVTQVETINALLIASEVRAERDNSGTLHPALAPIETARILGTKLYPRTLEILQQIGAGGFIQVPSTLADLHGPISTLAKRYFAGASVGAEEKVRLFKLGWDVIGSELGSRHELYERFYAGDPVRAAAALYWQTDKGKYTKSVWELLGKEEMIADDPIERRDS